ncbi:MAG: hypothetical protein JOY71_26900 [Acetobacteraceae bacterium]|nr:hypothetical protein [Acetobacteraceae bacterium]
MAIEMLGGEIATGDVGQIPNAKSRCGGECVGPFEMHLELTDEETFALLNLLTETIENDRYPLSPRIQTLRGILTKFGSRAPAPPPPARPPTPDERDPSRRPGGRSRQR